MEILFIPVYLAVGVFIMIVWLVTLPGTAKTASNNVPRLSVVKEVEPVHEPLLVEGMDGTIWKVQVVPDTGGKKIRRENLATGLVNHFDGDIDAAIDQLLGLRGRQERSLQAA